MIKNPLAKIFFGSLGYQTPGKKFRIWISLINRTEFKEKLGYESRFYIGSIQKKIGGKKSRTTVPIRQVFVFQKNKRFKNIVGCF
jgi:hypothetical protein